jgi:hypothetical protein
MVHTNALVRTVPNYYLLLSNTLLFQKKKKKKKKKRLLTTARCLEGTQVLTEYPPDANHIANPADLTASSPSDVLILFWTLSGLILDSS